MMFEEDTGSLSTSVMYTTRAEIRRAETKKLEIEKPGKRQRPENDGPEFLPLSKKLNNLHISFEDAKLLQIQHQQQSALCMPRLQIICECQNRPSTSHSTVGCHMCKTAPRGDESNRNGLQTSDTEMMCGLTPEASPHYYKNNKMLFALYVERTKRGGVYWQPSKYDG